MLFMGTKKKIILKGGRKKINDNHNYCKKSHSSKDQVTLNFYEAVMCDGCIQKRSLLSLAFWSTSDATEQLKRDSDDKESSSTSLALLPPRPFDL